MKTYHWFVSILFFTFFIFFFPLNARASTYNSEFILSDETYRSGSSLSASEIQSFLESKNSSLVNESVIVSNIKKSASQIISEVSIKYNINPKILLAIAQKESGAIERSRLSQFEFDRIMGYAVSNPDYRGLFHQFDRAARQFQRYFDNPERYYFQPGLSRKTNDDVIIIPQNRATAGLYNYTPYAGKKNGSDVTEDGGGNFKFWKLWQTYFSYIYPDGVLLRAKNEPGVFLIQNGKRWGFWSRQVYLESYSNVPVVQVPKEIFHQYPLAGPVRFNDGTVIQAKNGATFVITEGYRKPITSYALFKQLGYEGKHIVHVSEFELMMHPSIEPFNPLHIVRQNGALVKIKEKPGVFLIKDGEKRPILHKDILSTRFQHVPIINISQVELDTYKTGRAVEFRDGSLIRDNRNGRVYLISRGIRRYISHPSILEDLKMKSYPVTSVEGVLIDLHPQGSNLKVNTF